MYKLIIEDDEGKTTIVPLIRDEVTIGRKEGNTIRLTERNVSRRHAKLVKASGSIIIEDLQSYNGIKINGGKIEGRATIAEGDRIQIGDYQLALKIDKQTAVDDHDEKTTPFIRADEEDEATRQHTAVNTPALERPARVVVVSSNFAGQEFLLDKPLVVIGRTADNDITINHRSISRHHAQIMRENGHYHVVDLQSANGVRVNGEDYGKVELRRGDHIDLGHVRLRFVSPNDDFVFIRDAEVVNLGDKKGKGLTMLGIALVALVALGIGGFAVYRLTANKNQGKAQDIEAQVAKLSMEANKAMRSLEWDTAISKCEEGLQLAPRESLLLDVKAKADTERKNRVTYEKFNQAVKDGNVDDAVAFYQDIPEDSVYRSKTQEAYGQLKPSYVALHLKQARGLTGRCEELRKQVEKILMVEENHVEAQDLAKRCGGAPVRPPVAVAARVANPRDPAAEVRLPPVANTRPSQPTVEVAAAPDPQPATPPPVAVTPQPRVAAPTPPPQPHVAAVTPPPQPRVAATPRPDPVERVAEGKLSAEEAEKALSDAKDDYIHGNYTGAIEKAKKSLKGINNTQPWRIIGASSCFLKDKPSAIAAWNRLGAQDRQFLKYVCARNSIELSQ